MGSPEPSRLLEKRSIAVIGGTTGLGLSAARACVAAGGRVVVCGRDPERVAAAGRELGEAGFAMVGDARDPAAAERVIEEVCSRFGMLHGLYHVAGGSGRGAGDGPLHEASDEGWHRTLEENLSSVFYSNRAAARAFLRQGTGGAVLNMSSVLAFSPSPRYFATHAYATAKAGIIGLTRAAASYYAPFGIRFNALALGLTRTPMARRAAGDRKILEFIRTKQPLDGGRIGDPEDADAAAVYFLSDGSRFVTGQVLAVDGGWCIAEGQLPEVCEGGELERRERDR